MRPVISRAGPIRSAGNIRVEHWVAAERQGQTAARNMLGHREVFEAAPFFWSLQYDLTINYVGHAETWDEIVLDSGQRGLGTACCDTNARAAWSAVASIYRDLAEPAGRIGPGAKPDA